MKKDSREYRSFEKKLFMILVRNLMIAFLVIFLLYRMIWRRRGGDVIVQLLCRILHISEYEAVRRYSLIFRNYEPLFFIFSISLAFFTLLIVTLHAYLRYFEQINQGINALLLEDGGKISLPPELSSVESKLNTVRMTLAKRKHDIETQNQRKDDLILYLAHDIRTPLTSVIGYLDLLAQTQPLSEADQAKYLSIIREKAYRLGDLVEEFFQITKAGYSPAEADTHVRMDLILLLQQIRDELYPLFKERSVSLKLLAPDALPVYGSPVLLMRAFSNLMKNAASYAPANTIVSLTVTQNQEEGKAGILIKNQADYMDEDEISRLFEKMYRRDPSRSSKTGGSGLGLPIAKEILEIHGGTIRAYYKAGELCFMMILPLMKEGRSLAKQIASRNTSKIQKNTKTRH